jgi:cytochrome b pre-mRNA-processing protein 3
MPQLMVLFKSMILKRLFGSGRVSERPIYEAIVAAARRPLPYVEWGVGDTFDGRFDMAVLHLFLVLDRLRGEDSVFRQALTDLFFSEMDRALRESGVGDLSVGKRVRKMAEACYGRIGAYEQALQQGEDALAGVIARNFFPEGGGQESARKLARYVLDCRAMFAEMSPALVMKGKFKFPEPRP